MDNNLNSTPINFNEFKEMHNKKEVDDFTVDFDDLLNSILSPMSQQIPPHSTPPTNFNELNSAYSSPFLNMSLASPDTNAYNNNSPYTFFENDEERFQKHQTSASFPQLSCDVDQSHNIQQQKTVSWINNVMETSAIAGNLQSRESSIVISNLVTETENFMIRLLQSSLDEKISKLTVIKDELISYASKPIDSLIESDIMNLITKCTNFNPDMLALDVFFNKDKDERMKYQINSLNYGLMICLMHLKYLKNIQNFSHRLRISLPKIVFRRFTVFVTSRDDNVVSKIDRRVVLYRIKDCMDVLCRMLAKEFNLQRDIIIFMQKKNYKKIMLQTYEQFDVASLNYMKRITHKRIPQLLDTYKYKLSVDSWPLPLSVQTIPILTFNCSNVAPYGECVDFSEFSHNYKLADGNYIMTIQSMFACSVVDVLNSKNCLTTMTVNYTKIPQVPSILQIIEQCTRDLTFVKTYSQHSSGVQEDLFLPDHESQTVISKPFFYLFRHFTDITMTDNEKESKKYNMRVLIKYFQKIEAFKYKKTTSTEISGTEFYDIYFSTDIYYKIPLIDMFSIAKLEAQTSHGKLINMDIQEIFKLNDINTNADSIFMKNEFLKMMDLTTPTFSREHENLHAQIIKICNCNSADWTRICGSLAILLQREHILSMNFIVVMYFYYCSQYGIEPQISVARLKRACLAINDVNDLFVYDKYIKLLELFFEKHNIQLDSGALEPADDNDTTGMLKHILQLMIKNGHVTSVVGLLMRLDVIQERMKLQRIIIYCMDLLGDTVTDYDKYILLTMLNITEVDGDENISLAIKCCFFPNIMLYFLCDFHEDTEFTKRVRQFIEFFDGHFKNFCLKNTNDATIASYFTSEQDATGNANNSFVDFPSEDNDIVSNDGDETALVLMGTNNKKRKRKKTKSKSGGGGGGGRGKSKKSKVDSFGVRSGTLTEIFASIAAPLQSIISRYIGFCFKKSAITYAYDKYFYRDMTELTVPDPAIFGIEFTIVEPSHNAYWYRRRPGIYNSFTRAFEKHSPALFGVISLETPIWIPNDYDFNSFDYELKNKLFDTTLKAIHFLNVCGHNRLMTVLLGPLQDPNQTTGPLADMYPVKSVQILYSDLYSSADYLRDDYYSLVNSQYTKLNHVLLWFYMIVCELSKTLPNIQYLITHPGMFLSQMFMGIDSDIYGVENDDTNEIELNLNAGVIDNHQIEDRTNEQYQALDRMWNVELADTTLSSQTNADNNDRECDELLTDVTILHHVTNTKFYDVQIFSQIINRRPDEYVLANTRKLWNDIEINGGHTTKLFLLQLVSWFIRMDTFHPYVNTSFFKFINDNKCVSLDFLRWE